MIGWPRPSSPSRPSRTLFSLRTAHLLGLPIDLKVADIVALIVVGLPRGIRSDRTNQLDPGLALALHDQLRTHVGRVHQMLVRAQSMRGQIRLDGLGQGD